MEIKGDRIRCDYCKTYEEFVSVARAARLANLNQRSIRRYLAEHKIFGLKIGGFTIRVCIGCLLKKWTES